MKWTWPLRSADEKANKETTSVSFATAVRSQNRSEYPGINEQGSIPDPAFCVVHKNHSIASENTILNSIIPCEVRPPPPPQSLKFNRLPCRSVSTAEKHFNLFPLAMTPSLVKFKGLLLGRNTCLQ